MSPKIPIELTPNVKLGSTGHKGIGEPLDPTIVRGHLASQAIHISSDFASGEGGLLFNSSGQPVGYVRHRNYRLHPEQELTCGDFGRLSVPDIETGAVFTAINTAGELEVYGFNLETGDVQLIMEPGSTTREALDASGIAITEEMSLAMVELDFAHGTDHETLGMEMLITLQRLGQIAAEGDWHILPTSILPTRDLRKEDLNQRPYTQNLWLNKKGWDRAQYFTGAGYQILVDALSSDTAPYALNRYQEIGDLFYALSLNAPFTHGRQFGLSGRFDSRVKGSSGGVYETPLPESYDELNRLINERLQRGEIASPARVNGDHVDRLRMDIGDGVIEICGPDTAGGDPVLLTTLKYAVSAFLWKTEYLKHTDQTDVFRRWPALFSEEITSDVLAPAKSNHHEAANRGMIAETTGADGKPYYAFERFDQLLEFLNEPVPDGNYHGLPKGIERQLRLSAAMGIRGRDSIGAMPVSMANFYKERIATPAHWMHFRYRQILRSQYEQGRKSVDRKAALISCISNQAIAYAAYLQSPQAKHEIHNLFR